MAVTTSTFGGWTLTGRDAEYVSEYLEKNRDKAPENPAAQKTMENGKGMTAQYRKQGYVSISTKKA